MKNIFAVVLFTLLAFSVSFAQTEKEKQEIQTKIGKVLSKQVKAWNKGNIEGFMKGYWKSTEMLFISGNTISRGWQAAFDRYKKGYDTKEKMGQLSFSELEMTFLGKDGVVVIGRFLLQRKNDNPTGLFTLTFQKIGRKWKIIIDHTSG